LAFRPISGDPLSNRQMLIAAALNAVNNPAAWLTCLQNASVECFEADNKIAAREEIAACENIAARDKIAVTLAMNRDQTVVEVDEVVALVGYTPDVSIYEQLQVHQCYATAGPIKLAAALMGDAARDCLSAGSAISAESLRNPEPNFFILGAKSYGTQSNFLLQTGHTQIRQAFDLIGRH
jgi:hypothetical protein